jgi:lambda family phage holin
MTPDKDPSIWADIWFALSSPTWQGAIMAVIISVLRVLYDANETRKLRVVLEALICGGLSLSASSIIEWMAWPSSLSVSAGGAIGFIGVATIRELIIRLIGKKVDSI